MNISIKVTIVIIWSYILVLTSLDFISTDYIVENNFNTTKQALKNTMLYEVDKFKEGEDISEDDIIRNFLLSYIENQNTKIDLTLIDFLIISDNPPLLLIRTTSKNKNGYLDSYFTYDEIHGVLIEEEGK